MAQQAPRASGRKRKETDRLTLDGGPQYEKNRALTVTHDLDPNTQEPARKFQKTGGELVGTRVEVWFSFNRKWFPGRVDRYDAAHRSYYIIYADGEQKWHELDHPGEEWRALAPAAAPAHGDIAGRSQDGAGVPPVPAPLVPCAPLAPPVPPVTLWGGKGSKVEALDGPGTWYEASVLDERGHGDARELFVHYKGWKARYDEWLGVGSGRLRAAGSGELRAAAHWWPCQRLAAAATAANVEAPPALLMPRIGSRIGVLWTGRWGGWYAGRVISVRRSPSGGSLHQVHYDDGEKKTHDLRVVTWKVLNDADDDHDVDLVSDPRVVDLIRHFELPDNDDDVRWLEIEADVPELLTGNAVRYRPLRASYDLEPASLPPLEFPDEAEGEELNELCVELCDSAEYLEMMPAIGSPRTSSSPSSCGQRDEDGDEADVVSGYGKSDEDEAEEEAEEEAEDEAEALLPASLPRPVATLFQEGQVLRTSAEISRLLATMV